VTVGAVAVCLAHLSTVVVVPRSVRSMIGTTGCGAGPSLPFSRPGISRTSV